MTLYYASHHGDTRYSIGVGDTVVLSPATDLWMQGATHASVQKIAPHPSGIPILTLKSTHPQVRKPFKLHADYVSPNYKGFLHADYKGCE